MMWHSPGALVRKQVKRVERRKDVAMKKRLLTSGYYCSVIQKH